MSSSNALQHSPEKLVCAPIKCVEPGSPADDAGFYPGCAITSVDGNSIRDIIDWRWHADGEEIAVGYLEPDGEEGITDLIREPGQDWGITFDGLIFDGVKLCRNACTFCFMRQLPQGMRGSLSMRDDDFRLSFLTGTFVTLTNISDEDISRIISQRISPIRMSLHAIDADVRRKLIGKHHGHGLQALDKLLEAGIEVHAQIVLVPGENDGEELAKTLDWAYGKPGITDIGIVPLGFTRHQCTFDVSFNTPDAALCVLDTVRPYQKRAAVERGHAWVYAADEFYLSAYGETVLDHLPDASFYNGFPMFEDGIGIVRSCVDDMKAADAEGYSEKCREALEERCAYLICGEAMRPYIGSVLAASPLADVLHPLFVKNAFFGGNVNVTGLLCGCDMTVAIREIALQAYNEAQQEEGAREPIFLLPRCAFNDDMLTLDGMDCGCIADAAGAQVYVVSSNPLDCIKQIPQLI